VVLIPGLSASPFIIWVSKRVEVVKPFGKGPKTGLRKVFLQVYFLFWIAATIAGVAKRGPFSQARVRFAHPCPQVEAATAQVQRRKWKWIISRFRRGINCFLARVGDIEDIRRVTKHNVTVLAKHLRNFAGGSLKDLSGLSTRHLRLLLIPSDQAVLR
jgi:hypothetical protein